MLTKKIMLLLLLLLSLLFVNASICPLIFIVVEYPITTTTLTVPTIMVEYGNYFICSGRQFPAPYSIPDYDLDIYFPFCNQQAAVFVNSKCSNNNKVSKWILWECQRLGRLNCFVRQLNGVYYSIRVPVSGNNTGTPSIRTMMVDTTPVPTIPLECDDIDNQMDCGDNGCNWFGTLIKCQRKTYCEGLTMIPCLSRKMFCTWKGNKCKEK